MDPLVLSDLLNIVLQGGDEITILVCYPLTFSVLKCESEVEMEERDANKDEVRFR